jgi:hypothetical protein
MQSASEKICGILFASRVTLWPTTSTRGLTRLMFSTMLPVEIGRLDVIEIGDYELADTRPGKSDGYIGAEAAEAGDTDC